MKKLLALLLCLSLIFSLAACGGETDADEKDSPDAVEEVEDNDNDNDADDKDEDKDDVDKPDVDSPEDATDESKPDSVTPTKGEEGTTKPATGTIKPTPSKPGSQDKNTPSATKVSRGEISGDVYTNAFAGFSFTKPADWAYLTDEEISQVINLGQSIVELSDIEKALAETSAVYDMAAMSPYGKSVMICYTSAMLSETKKMTLDEYETTLKDEIENTDYIDYEFQSSENTTLGNGTYRKIVFSASISGIEMTQVYYARVIDKYIVTVIVSADASEVEAIEAMFSK